MWGETRDLSVDTAVGEWMSERREFQTSSFKSYFKEDYQKIESFKKQNLQKRQEETHMITRNHKIHKHIQSRNGC